MNIQVGLSGENIDSRLPNFVNSVGLLRSEYICRRLGKHIPDIDCQREISSYILRVLEIFGDRPVWYRFFDAPSHEVNMLENYDAYIIEEVPLLGIRGMRRSLLFKKTFETEFKLVAEIARDHPNLNVIFPYINEQEEVEFGLEVANKTGFSNKISIMVETPAAVELAKQFCNIGIEHFLVGMNDLSSLYLGASRGSGFDRHNHPAIKNVLIKLREDLRDKELSIGGYISRDFLKIAEQIGFDNLIVHYSSLPKILGIPEMQELEDMNFMAGFKVNDNKKRFLQWSSDLMRVAQMEERSGLQGSEPMIIKSAWLEDSE